ncbi:MAG: hypothetical protein IPN59_02580 [Holophaga sp.]|nr:hypothetical protein [Holophaga sp.]
MKARQTRTLDHWVAKALLLLGSGLLLMALSKPLLLAAGARTKGFITFQEGGVSTRGAYGVRYHFTAQDGQAYTGTAFTAVKDARFARVTIAYLPFAPSVNTPASVAYAIVTGFGWGLAGLLALMVGKSLGKPSTRT